MSDRDYPQALLRSGTQRARRPFVPNWRRGWTFGHRPSQLGVLAAVLAGGLSDDPRLVRPDLAENLLT